jgi:hypothetical protein
LKIKMLTGKRDVLLGGQSFKPLQQRDTDTIASISLSDGTTITEHADKENIIYQTYKERLGSCSTPQMQFDLASLITPTPGLEELSAPFTKEEIDEVVKHMPPDKAPGPDGFNGLFLKC